MAKLDTYMEKQMLEIGLVLCPGVKQAAILGLTDLFRVANRMAAEHIHTPTR